MAVLLILFSSVLYFYIEYSIKQGLEDYLLKQSRFILANYNYLEKDIMQYRSLIQETLKIEIQIKNGDFSKKTTRVHFKNIKKDGQFYLQGHFIYKDSSCLLLTANVTQQKRMEKRVFQAIIIMVITSMAMILVYALFLSNMLLSPIKVISSKLAKMNENILLPIDTENVPFEFKPLAKSINLLVNRIKNFLLYKKELFVGAAHELKTPLAVIKTRSQVALIKKSSTKESYEKVIRENIETLNGMNDMISAILEFGRAEGAQFEKPQEIDLILFLKNKMKEFTLLAKKENKKLKYRFSFESYTIKIQPLLLTQIIQNLLQNAIRYTPEGGTIRVSGYKLNRKFVIKITDEGKGIDENMDIFAPFIRSKNSKGAGLGLFLVKSASDAIGAKVEIKNREDCSGTVATFVLPTEK
jgi:two-component system OmpR family sensor kinase